MTAGCSERRCPDRDLALGGSSTLSKRTQERHLRVLFLESLSLAQHSYRGTGLEVAVEKFASFAIPP